MSKYKAFSALELTIVLTILSILVTVVISASNIKTNANINSFVKEANVVLTSVLTFSEKYSGLPGDIADGYSLFGDNCGTSLECSGNGDGYIALDSDAEVNEKISSFIHLSFAGMVDKTYDRTNYQYVFANNGLGILNYVETSDNYQVSANTFVALSGSSDYQFFEPSNAYKVDFKMDDGLPEKGFVTYFSNGQSGCVSAGSYIEDDDNKKCALVFLLVN